MNMKFKDYEQSHSSSKAEFQHFLQRKTSDRKLYDSSVSHALTHHYKVLAYKENELNKRAIALDGF